MSEQVPPLKQPIIYILDEQDTIVATNTAWDLFATENAAPELIAPQVIGRNLYDFVTGEITQQFVRTLIQRARTSAGSTVRAYRCDSTSFRREMKMTMTPTSRGLQLAHQIIRIQPLGRELRFTVPIGTVPPKTLKRCSSCLKVSSKDTPWVEAENLMAQAHKVYETVVPVIYDICPSCSR